ncbi:MAG: hypothetical protein E4H36_00125 [Spirochaetales bacterium]|nr:MAG: hypothetical protein E4H36_00125 [Spirochaetales bacterium]
MRFRKTAAGALILALTVLSALHAGGRKEEINMISLNMLTDESGGGQGDAVIEAGFLPGQHLSYTFELYESVGFDADYRISDQSVLAFVERKEKYVNPKQMRQGMTGADDAEGTFVFRTLKPGRATLIILHLFRGDVEKEISFRLTVE